MRMFLRKTNDQRDPLAVTMIGIRMGEKLLQIGVDDPALLGALTAKVGLSGHAAVVVADPAAADRARAGMTDAGALADVHVGALHTLPVDTGLFDVVVIHGARGLMGSLDAGVRGGLLRDVHRTLRTGGRLIALEPGERTGLKAWLSAAPPSNPQYEQAGGTLKAAEDAGFRPVRLLADRDGIRFIEALKP